MTYQTHGIILKKTDHKEADQLFSIYTLKQGKILALGRGTKKISSKLNPHLQTFSVVDLMIASGKNYDHIAGVLTVKIFLNIKKDLKKIILGNFALEIVDKLTKPGQPDSKIFILLSKYFEAINNNLFTDNEWQIIKQAFVIKLLSLLGFKPTVDIAEDSKRLDNFLKQHLEAELQTDKFLIKIFT